MTGQSFNFWNERVAYDVEDLLKCIHEISDEEFSSYVNGKNDFANWISDSLKYEDLAERIRPLSERDLIIAILSDFLDKGKAKMMIGSTKSVGEDELIKEIMEKNDNFLGVKEEKKEEIENPEEQKVFQGEEKNNKNIEPKDNKNNVKGSSIAFVDFPKRHHSLDKEFFIGLTFGFIIGILLTLILSNFFLWI